MTGTAGTVGDRLRGARARRFVGRVAERAVFASAMGANSPEAVLWVYGPGGIGKSALLDQFADDARAAGRRVVRVDGRDVGASPSAFAAAAAVAPGTQGAVVLADTFEQCDGLEGWLRQDFAPGLPSDAVLVVASQQPPGLEWRAAPAWSEMLQVIALSYLPAADATALLEARNVPVELRESLLS